MPDISRKEALATTTAIYQELKVVLPLICKKRATNKVVKSLEEILESCGVDVNSIDLYDIFHPEKTI